MFIVHQKLLQRIKNKRFTFLFLLLNPCLFVSTTKISYVAVEYNGCLYVFGGYNGLLDTHFSDLYKFDPGKALTLSSKIVVFRGLQPSYAVIAYSFTSKILRRGKAVLTGRKNLKKSICLLL